MNDLVTRSDGRLAGSTVAILMESDYVEPEIAYYLRRFAEEGARTLLATRLWGQSELTFTGHEFREPFTVDHDLEEVTACLDDLDALIVPSGMVSDRLRYSEDPADISPAVRLLEDAFARPRVLKGIICHGMWLAAPVPHVVAGRRVTCHNNLVSDIANMGAVYVDQDVVVDDDLVTARSADRCHLFARMIIDKIVARRDHLHPGRHTAAPVATRQRAEHRSTAPTTDATVSTTDTTAPTTAATTAPTGPTGNVLGATMSDLVAGYVVDYDPQRRLLDLRTSDGRAVRATLHDQLGASFLRNLGEPERDAGAHLDELLVPGRHVFVHGTVRDATRFTAHRLVVTGTGSDGFAFTDPQWWVHQLHELAAFYRRAQFGSSYPVDYRDYRTYLRLGGDKSDNFVQETDTISRLVYGMASAFMLTGEDDFLHVAERGTAYLRDHMRFVDREDDVVYWYHGIDVRGEREHKLFTSEFGDDYDAIPMYEQIYALAGPTQLFRITGDPAIHTDIDATMRLLAGSFKDPVRGGWFSHIDPILMSPTHESLGPNAGRKNWNSIGDHAPAYLFNLYLATHDERHLDMLEECFDLIVEHFPADDSPFVQERFHADWTPDRTWGWQQDRAVVGHNLKIAWNLSRMRSLRDKPAYRDLAARLGRTMPPVGSDRQRGGWYDVLERARNEAGAHDFVWHDRKAWWQQEQAILAYQILAGTQDDRADVALFRDQAREAASFYNAFFLDHDEGGVYFNVLADGMPYLLGNERLKGNHSMSMYHSAELCFLASTYERLLLGDDPMTLHFRPQPDGFRDRVLRVAPDALPPGSVRLDAVTIDGERHDLFDADSLSVKLPDSSGPVHVTARIVPTTRGER